MALSYKEELFEDMISEAIPLFYAHWEEVANHQDIRPLDIDYAQYIQLNRMGLVRFFTVRDEGKLIGYISLKVSNNPHYKTWKYAVSDVYYLDPAYRKTGTSVEFFSKIEEWLKSMDVKSVTIQDKIDHSHEKFFNSLGFKTVEQVYEKVF